MWFALKLQSAYYYIYIDDDYQLKLKVIKHYLWIEK